MTIADKLNYLNDTKQAIKQAITDKGVDVLETDTFRSYANKIASIESGGGSGADYKSSLMATTTQSAYSPSIVSLSDYVLPDYTIEKGQTGLLYPKRTTTVVTENFTNRNCTIQNGIASGFSNTNYIEVDKPFQPDTKNWKIVTRIKAESITTMNRVFGCINHWYSTPALEIGDGLIGCGISDSTSDWGISWLNSGTNVFKVNEWCFLKVEYQNGTYSLSKSEDGIIWDTLASYVSEKIVYQANTPLLVFGTYNYQNTAWPGQIDLNNTYIEVDDELYWSPYTIKEKYSLNVPDLSHGYRYSSQTLAGLTYINNILKNTTYSSAGRIDTGVKLNVSADDSWEWCIRFKQTAKGGGSQYIMNHDHYQTGPYLALESTNILQYNVRDGSYVAGGSMTEPLELNTWYTVRVGSTGNSYFMQYKKDGEEWSEVSCDNATNLVALSPTTEIRIGKPSHDGLLIGEWDFSQSYIKINGKMLWPNNAQKYKGICTKDFLPQVGTNTLNAYHIEYTDGTSECLLGQTEPTGEDIKSVQLLESGLTFEENKAWTYNEDSEQFE